MGSHSLEQPQQYPSGPSSRCFSYGYVCQHPLYSSVHTSVSVHLKWKYPKTNQISRFIPEAPWHCKLPYSMVLGGILPFGSVCIEMFFILGALWLHQIYYVVGFLLLVILILMISCAEVAIMMCYMQLSAEDHQWWWRSFLNTASAGGYLFLYCLWFLSTKLDLVGFLPVLVYLTYMSMLSLAFAIFCGAVGFLSCFTFNKMIYGALKVD